MNDIKLIPGMHGLSWNIESKMKKYGYAQKMVGTALMENRSFINYTYYEIDSKAEVLMDANSKYGVIWYFPN